jgi:hypothetical protein
MRTCTCRLQMLSDSSYDSEARHGASIELQELEGLDYHKFFRLERWWVDSNSCKVNASGLSSWLEFGGNKQL